MYIKGEICVFLLFTTTFLASSRPHPKSKRSIVKDYLNPLTYPTAEVQFEKGEDGKYHPHMIDSKVEYALAQNLADLSAITKDAVEPADSKDEKHKARDVLEEELGKVASDLAPKPHVEDKAKVNSGFFSETPTVGFGSGAATKVNSESGLKEIDKESDEKGKSRYTLVKQEDHKLQFLPKPGGKDDLPYELEAIPLEGYNPRPPLAAEEGKNKKESGVGKLIIGQIPFFGSLPFFGSPSIFLPERSFSFGVLSRLPLPPALAVQDRLPDAEVMEEGSETALVENVDPADGMVRGERRTVAHRFSGPFGSDFAFPLDAMKKSLKELMDGQSLGEKSKSQVVDVVGKKMLLQNKVFRYPTDDTSRVYVGVMSVRPLDEVDPDTLKKIGVGKETKGIDKTHREMEDKIQAKDKRIGEKPILNSGIDKVPINLSEELKKLGFDIGRHSETDVLKVEESKLEENRETSDDGAVLAQASGVVVGKDIQSGEDSFRDLMSLDKGGSASKVTFLEKKTKQKSLSDGSLRPVGREHGINTKSEKNNEKKLPSFETKKLQGVVDTKELGEEAVTKKISTEIKVKNAPEKILLDDDSDKSVKTAADSSVSGKKSVDALDEDDSKFFPMEIVSTKESEIIVTNEESTNVGNSHEMLSFYEAGDKKKN